MDKRFIYVSFLIARKMQKVDRGKERFWKG